MRKLHHRWFHVCFTVIMAGLMSGMMTFVNTAVNFGFPPDFLGRWLRSYAVGFCVALPAIYVIAPWARKVAALLVTHPPLRPESKPTVDVDPPPQQP